MQAERSLDEAFGRLAAAVDYPMLIVTAAAGEERSGCLVGFATQCSIEPLRFLVCLSRQNRTYRVALRAGLLAVHLPGDDQSELAELFGGETGDRTDKFARCRWEPGPGGVPLLADCPSRFVGRVVDRVQLGDHVGFVLDLVAAWSEPDPRPISFQRVRRLQPGHPA